MTSTLLLNVILCSAVLVAVVTPLLWAILTAHRDDGQAVITKTRLDRGVTLARRTPRQPTPPQPRFRGAKHGQAWPTL